MKRKIFVILLVLLLSFSFPTTATTSTTIANEIPTFYNVSVTPDHSSAIPGTQIVTPPNVTVRIAAVVADYNNYLDINTTKSNCTWTAAGFTATTPIHFTNCSGAFCNISCEQNITPNDPAGVYTVNVTVFDSFDYGILIVEFTHSINPPVSITPPSAKGGLKSMVINASMACPDNVLIVEVKEKNGKPIPLVEVNILKTEPFIEHLATGYTNSSGITSFPIKNAGAYIIRAKKADYKTTVEELELSLCPVSQPPFIMCINDEDCADYQYCHNGICEVVTGVCGYPFNHTWVHYQCCSDEDCDPDEVCTDHVCVKVATEEKDEIPQKIEEIIDEVREDIIKAEKEGVDVSTAKKLLDMAEKELGGGNYTRALTLLKKAIDEIRIAERNVMMKMEKEKLTLFEAVMIVLTEGWLYLLLLLAMIILLCWWCKKHAKEKEEGS